MKKRPLCIVSIIYIIGILIGLYLQIGIVFSDDLYQELLNIEEANIEAIVTSQKQEKEYRNLYEIEIQKINGNVKYKGKKLILSQKKNDEHQEIKQGDLIKITGEYQAPEIARNYKGFNYREYLRGKNIYGTIYPTSEIKIIQNDADGFFSKIIRTTQSAIKENIRQLLPEETAELCIGILIGDRSNLSEEIEENFKNSNLTHMLAVSGAHISYILLGITFVLKKSGKKISKIITILFLIFFMALTNFTPSVMRASIMAILELISELCYRKSDIYQNLALSSLIILILNPYSILNIGFQLSFAGTIGIIVFHNKLSETIFKKIHTENKIIKSIIDLIIVTISANIAIIPIMAYQFNTVSLTFWISNLFASNLMGIIIIIGFITFLISLISMKIATIFAFLLNIILKILSQIAEICSQIPFSSILVETPYFISIIIYYGIMIFWRYGNTQSKVWLKENIKKKKVKILSITLILTIIVNISSLLIPNALQIYFIDVGQGDSCLIITPQKKTILIDGGGSETGNFDVGERTLIPYLLDRRIKKLDYVLISHFDTDHVGGILSVLQKLNVKNVIISKQAENSENYSKFKEIIKNKKINIILAKSGNKIEIDKTCELDILFPEEQQIQENKLNNNSIVAKFNYKSQFSMLFTGDIEQTAENRLLEMYKDTNKLESTILKVAHHRLKNIINTIIIRKNKT